MPATKEELKTKKGIIYQFINLVNGKCYIGQSRRTFVKRYKHNWVKNVDNEPLKRAIKKYGRKNFLIEILEHSLSPKELDEREEFFIRKFDSMVPHGYNLHSGGTNHKMCERVRREYVKRQRKQHSGNYVLMRDGRLYHFCILRQFARKHNLHLSGLMAVLKGKCRTCRGFHLPETDVRFKRSTDKIRYIVDGSGKIHKVYNIFRFAKQHGLSADCLAKVFARETVVHKGFHLVDPPIKKPRKPHRQKNFSKIILIKDGCELVVPDIYRAKFVKETKIDLYSLLCGRSKISKGYILHKAFDMNGTEISFNA